MPGEISRDTHALMVAVLGTVTPIGAVDRANGILADLGYTVERPLTPLLSTPIPPAPGDSADA